jgi:PKHD-type hydroxylase
MSVYPAVRDTVEPYAIYEEVFTPDECDAIVKSISALGLKDSVVNTVTGQNVFETVEDVRKSKTRFLLPTDSDYNSNWLFERLLDVTMDANNKFFGFNLWGFAEGIQFAEYEAPGGKYDFHIDKAYGNIIRKLSLSVNLTDPSTYEGGDLELMYSPKAEKIKRDRGTVILFPSYTLHRVTPVTSGVRNSLVAWITGDTFQ